MNGGSRFPLLTAAIASGAASVGSAVASITFPSDRILAVATALMASGFLYFVKRWMSERETAEREMVDTIRKHIEQQSSFEREVYHFMGLVKGHFGIHNADSNPELKVKP